MKEKCNGACDFFKLKAVKVFHS